MRNSYIAEHIHNMPPSGIRKFFDVASTMDDVISLGVGEPDFENTLAYQRSCYFLN